MTKMIQKEPQQLERWAKIKTVDYNRILVPPDVNSNAFLWLNVNIIEYIVLSQMLLEYMVYMLIYITF